MVVQNDVYGWFSCGVYVWCAKPEHKQPLYVRF